MYSGNETNSYYAAAGFIGRAHTQNDPCLLIDMNRPVTVNMVVSDSMT